MSEIGVAWDIALGKMPADPASQAFRIVGARNDYNCRGRGSTMSRRVYRGGAWVWVSRPASRGRFLAADRHDVKYGDVYIGEIVAEYTLGGSRSPDAWYLVVGGETPLIKLQGNRRRDGFYELRDGDRSIVVPDPYWR